MNRASLIARLLLMSALLLGCAHAVPPETRRTVDPGVTPEMLFQDPGLLRGKTVMLGGVVISSKNTGEGSYLEILERPLDSRGRPRDVDVSSGRFLIFSEKYLETAIFSQGREVTVVGEVAGTERRSLGEGQYTYPLIKSKEIYLFSPRQRFPIRLGIGVWTAF
jgi:outer membrane lipoprotein